jgi:hypothetical protein
MRKSMIISLIAIVCVLAVACIHDFVTPTTTEIRFQRQEGGALAISHYKDGGSLGIHVELKDRKEEVIFLDRSMVFLTPGSHEWEPKKEGLLYLGYNAMSASSPLDVTSPLAREFEMLLRFERQRWLVRVGYFGKEYAEHLSLFAVGLERTKKASKTQSQPVGGSS